MLRGGEHLLIKGAQGRRAPFNERGALLRKGARPFEERGLLGGRFGDFLLFFMQLRVDDN